MPQPASKLVPGDFCEYYIIRHKFKLNFNILNSRSVWERLRVSGTAANRFLAPRNEFWGPRAQRQARVKTGPRRFPVALSQKIIAHLTFSLFLKFLGCYSELPEAPDNEKIEETMKNQTCLTSRG